ncbi:hypothetical protein BDZ90DRAFT_234827 [Jaminaea rosea]|uniref:ER membrane protein complex subunit 2 n=1 Tax=Jaminaea rosea TaxID=1569628 RepID=A0A316UKT8_9BASI|nr:hypothetical protein BDZ90DRAFT_234827 [Jaminaea rosea]PWN24543.1 hypothetical protein BDZ90DRAFT_234827 [Jaminaea rosea]
MASSSSSSSSSSRSPKEIIVWLQEQRRRPDRQSAQTVEYGTFLLEKGYLSKLGDDLWATLEQIGIAALDVGDWELAELCLARLNTRFPKSTRVAALQGMLYEARGQLTRALHYYEELIAKSQGADIMLSKRRIAVLKSLDSPSAYAQTLPALETHLETYYSDPEAWQELASLYAELGQYAKSAAALEELMLLVPQNGFFVLRYAETQYTAGEYATAYKGFLRVLDMGGMLEKGQRGEGEADRGPEVRAAWGLKAVSRRAGQECMQGHHHLTDVPSSPALADDQEAEGKSQEANVVFGHDQGRVTG